MAKYCKPYNLYVTYMDCMDCEGKECRQKEVQKRYLTIDLGSECYIVYKAKRLGDDCNVVIKARLTHATCYEDGKTYYYFKPLKELTKQNVDLKQIEPMLICESSNIDTGYGKAVNRQLVFTTKEKCKEYLRG